MKRSPHCRARDAANGEAAAQKPQAASYKTDFIVLNVSNEANVKQAAQTVTVGVASRNENRYYQLDILANNTGIYPEFSQGKYHRETQ